MFFTTKPLTNKTHGSKRFTHTHLAAGVAALALTLTACGGQETDSANGSEEAEEVQTVVISMQRAIESAAVIAGMEQGIFEEHGIKVEMASSELGGPAAVPALVNGEIDLAMGSATGYLLARASGQPLQFVAPSSYAVTADGEEASAIVVPTDSEIQGPEDLKDKTIAVMAIGGLQTMATDFMMSNETDLTPDDYTYVELPLPNMSSAVAQGQVDAAYLFEPPLTQGLQAGDFREIATPLSQAWNGEAMALMFYGTEEWTEQNPEITESFRTALDESFQWVNENRDEFVQIAAEFTEMDPETIAASRIPEFRIDSDQANFESFAQDMIDLGVIDETPETTALLPPQ